MFKKFYRPRVYDVAVEHIVSSNSVRIRLGNEIIFEREDLTAVFSSKIRGGITPPIKFVS